MEVKDLLLARLSMANHESLSYIKLSLGRGAQHGDHYIQLSTKLIIAEIIISHVWRKIIIMGMVFECLMACLCRAVVVKELYIKWKGLLHEYKNYQAVILFSVYCLVFAF